MSNKMIAMLAVLAALLSSCSPSITKESAEKELVSFMLDFIVQQEIGGTANYIQTSGQPWVDAPPGANIIIWSPPVENTQSDSLDYVKSDAPIKVWLYSDHKLVEVTNKQEAVQKYKQTYMSNPQSNIWAWGYYEFGIMSISSNNEEATIYVGASCGPLCGHGVMYTVKRNSSGKWEIRDSKQLWIS
jgi:hypothetical protein